ncbi:MAG: hypothetical protein KY394_06035 [Actinobacteria bacterium]|nr:hypothetical protein [Actinomycetota bacterium]
MAEGIRTEADLESFEAFLRRIEELLDRVDELDDDTRDDVYELLDAVDTLHRRGMTTLVSALDPHSLARVREDPAAAWLLEAYDAAPGSVPVQITRKR